MQVVGVQLKRRFENLPIIYLERRRRNQSWRQRLNRLLKKVEYRQPDPRGGRSISLSLLFGIRRDSSLRSEGGPKDLFRKRFSRAGNGANSVRCRTSGARNSSGHRSQPFRAGLTSGAPPALWLCRGRFGIWALARPTGDLRVGARDSGWETRGSELMMCASERSAGGAEDLSPARQGWVPGTSRRPAPEVRQRPLRAEATTYRDSPDVTHTLNPDPPKRIEILRAARRI